MNLKRSSIIIYALFIFFVPNISFSDEANDALDFVESLGYEAIKMLADKDLNEENKIKKFEQLLDYGFDVPLIARYALGKYWRKTPQDKREKYVITFRKFIVASYAARLGQFGGEKFYTKSVKNDGKRGFVVKSRIETPNGTKIKVDWRVRNTNGTFRIYDVVIEGISMVITQRDEFSSIIQRSGGNIDTLIQRLESH